MAAHVQSMTLVGLGAQPVTVEVDLANGLPSFQIVGLPDKAVDEAKERVRAAIKNSGFEFPTHKITVNLAPADLPKNGPAFDLPIALGILAASGVIPTEKLHSIVALGELSLDGDIRPIAGVLPIALALKKINPRIAIVPMDNLEEAQLIGDLSITTAGKLRHVVEKLIQDKLEITDQKEIILDKEINNESADMANVGGLEQVKRVLEIAAAGNHNILLIGPPGTGKTLLARAFASILPDLNNNERLEVLTIRSAAGLLNRTELVNSKRPVRSPHHTASPVAVVGGGSKLRPGEVSLAHRGILFLDELPEFPRQVLEALREPLEENKITIARAQGAVTFPAQFILIAAANPCPCGYYGDPEKTCRCSAGDLVKYQKKLSGPLIDRIDLVVTVPRQSTKVLLEQPEGTPSKTIRERVEKARFCQSKRHNSQKTNGELSSKEIKQFILLTPEAKDFVVEAGNRLHLSGRGIHRLLKVSQTIADLDNSQNVTVAHLAEALQYRQNSLLERI